MPAPSLIIKELSSDFTPDRLDQDLFEKPYFFLLESSLPSAEARYSIAAWDPVKIYRPQNNENPFDFFEKELASQKVESDLPFSGGWIGYFGYELYSHLESKVAPREPDLIPQSVFCLYESFYLYDHRGKKAFWVSSNHRSVPKIPPTPLSKKGGRDWSPPLKKGEWGDLSKQTYLQAVQKIKNFIEAGDCYQVNFSQRFSSATNLSPYQIYQNLCSTSPAPYAAFLNLGDVQIISSSPECFLKLDGRHVTTRPIKGTRRRGKTAEEDQRLKEELEKSFKDHAELLMITDLERNDLGRVCKPGSVQVTEQATLESYAQVHHLVATIEGELSPQKTVMDLLRATFPGGSITGAPKVRAMQMIRELETHARNIYCGAIGFLSSNQKAHFNIAIRTLVLKDKTAHFWGGGGIVADSTPHAEYEETLAKAEGIVLALDPDRG